jgi:hypothetical protein
MKTFGKASRKTSRYLLTAAIAGIVAGGSTATVVAADTSSTGTSKRIKCYNTCTGKGACKTATHACKGQNGCEGDGKAVMMSAEECTKTGGLLKEPKAPAFPMPPVKPSSST